MASAFALAIFSGIGFLFGIQKSLRAFLNPLFTSRVVTENGICYTGADSFALNGAFVGYGVDYVQLGEATADMVAELLCEGKTTADLPYQTFDNGIVTINTETCEALGLDLDTVKEAFKPYCTEIVEVTTAENFS